MLLVEPGKARRNLENLVENLDSFLVAIVNCKFAVDFSVKPNEILPENFVYVTKVALAR